MNLNRILATLAAFALSVAVAGPGDAAPAHTIVWSPKNAAPGTIVTLAGQPFVLIRIPVRDLGSTRRFMVSFLATKTGTFVQAPLPTVHSRDPLANPSEIDGFDAVISVSDSRSYHVNTNFIPPDDDYVFQVIAHASCTVQIKLGATLVSFGTSFSAIQQPLTNIGAIPNAVPHAEWADYVHPSPQVTACNNWIDYIRVREL
jgi:hypothetical protein